MSDINKLRRRLKKTGLPPGELVQFEQITEQMDITIFDYDKDNLIEKKVKDISECFVFKNKKSITWINIDSNQSKEVIEKLGNCYQIHPLILEDIMTSGQRPKFEDLGEYLFIILKMIYPGANKKNVIIEEQLCLLIGNNFVISIQEKPGDPFNVIRERIRKNLGRIRKMGADYLAYCLIDVIIDNYFIILETISENMEYLEEETLEKPTVHTLEKIHSLKRELIFFRKFIWPLREVINVLIRSESKLIDKDTFPYIRDLYDHVIQVIDSIETFRDITSSFVEIYLSSVSNKMNVIMKRLTLINCIFMPLTVIAGIGGMSEWSMITGARNWFISYPLFLAGLGIIGFITYKIFKWKGWT